MEHPTIDFDETSRLSPPPVTGENDIWQGRSRPLPRSANFTHSRHYSIWLVEARASANCPFIRKNATARISFILDFGYDSPTSSKCTLVDQPISWSTTLGIWVPPRRLAAILTMCMANHIQVIHHLGHGLLTHCPRYLEGPSNGQKMDCGRIVVDQSTSCRLYPSQLAVLGLRPLQMSQSHVIPSSCTI